MSARIALVALRLENHFIMADGAGLAGAGAHVAALQAVVYPAMLVDIQKNIAAASRATLGFPFRHVINSIFKPGINITWITGLII
jgi:hypothetical protein